MYRILRVKKWQTDEQVSDALSTVVRELQDAESYPMLWRVRHMLVEGHDMIFLLHKEPL